MHAKKDTSVSFLASKRIQNAEVLYIAQLHEYKKARLLYEETDGKPLVLIYWSHPKHKDIAFKDYPSKGLEDVLGCFNRSIRAAWVVILVALFAQVNVDYVAPVYLALQL